MSRSAPADVSDPVPVDASGRLDADALVRRHEGLVRTVAAGYRGLGVDLDDLSQEGRLALIAAAEAFDPALGVPFANFAADRIRWACIRHLRNTGRVIRIPNHVHDEMGRLRRAIAAVEETGGRADPAGLAAWLDWPVGRVEALLPLLAGIGSLDRGPTGSATGTDGGPGSALVERIVATDSDRVDRWITVAAARSVVLRLLARCNDREREIIGRRFGLVGGPQSLREVAAAIGLTKERVRQIEAEVLRRFRSMLDPRDWVLVGSGSDGPPSRCR